MTNLSAETATTDPMVRRRSSVGIVRSVGGRRARRHRLQDELHRVVDPVGGTSRQKVLEDRAKVVRRRATLGTGPTDDPYARVAQRPELGDVAARVRISKDDEPKGRDRQSLVDD